MNCHNNSGFVCFVCFELAYTHFRLVRCLGLYRSFSAFGWLFFGSLVGVVVFLGWLVARLVNLLISLVWLLIGCLVCSLVSLLVGWSVGWCVGSVRNVGFVCLVGRSVVSWSVGRSVGWLVGRWLFGD